MKNNLSSAFAVPVKLFLIPLAAYLIFGKTGFLNGDYINMFVLLCATPSGMSLPIVADIAEADSAEYASAGVVISTVMCLFTIPIIAWITR